jgi:hypothetical protein
VARDLIPPPSPAGKPPPDPQAPGLPPGPATQGGEGELWAGGRGALAPPPPPRERRREVPPPAAVAVGPVGPSPFRGRFGLVTGALVGLAACALVLAGVLLAAAGSDGAPDGWSPWRPAAGDELAAARQIAAHVGPEYRLATGDQLVTVEASGLQFGNPPGVEAAGVAVRSAPQGGNVSLLQGDAVMYTLNGLGDQGSIATGTASKERGLLLRREALELALYTFQYARQVDMVVVLLPPPPPAARTPGATGQAVEKQVLLFRPGDLRAQLDRPLEATIPPPTPRPETLPPDQGRRIDALTRGNLFLVTALQQAQNGRVFLVLDRAQG